MNWKDYPRLFTNGKFKVKIEGFDNPAPFTPYWFREITREEPMPECTLIARKIEDMGNHELRGSFSDEFDGRDFLYWKNRLIDIANSGTKRMNVSNFLHLLSIGVYPFSQEHFETGEVIDINEAVEG